MTPNPTPMTTSRKAGARLGAGLWMLGLIAVAVTGCADTPTAPLPGPAALAKGAPNTNSGADFTIIDAGMSLQGDGKGVYQDGVCGVAGWWDVIGISGQLSLGGRLTKSQLAACGGTRRAAGVTLALRHVSDNPQHVDENVSPTLWNLVNVNWGSGGNNTTTINAGNNGTPICGTLGLRFSSIAFPGTSDTKRESLGGGLWHLSTQPWPDNIAYCENGGVVTYWHVSFDMYAQVAGT